MCLKFSCWESLGMKQNRKIIAGGCRVKGGHFKMRNSRACLCVYKNDPVERDS